MDKNVQKIPLRGGEEMIPIADIAPLLGKKEVFTLVGCVVRPNSITVIGLWNPNTGKEFSNSFYGGHSKLDFADNVEVPNPQNKDKPLANKGGKNGFIQFEEEGDVW
jgi:hypothetical protein